MTNPNFNVSLRCAALCSALFGTVAIADEEPTLKPADNLVVEGIPPIPMSVVDAVGRYTEFRSAVFAGWHPEKKEMLIRTRFGDTAQIHRVLAPGADRYQLTFFPESVGGGSYGPLLTEGFMFSKDVGGNEVYQFYRYDLATGESRLLTDGKSRNTDPLWSTSGEWLAYMSNRRNGADSDLYVLAPEVKNSERKVIELQGGGWGTVDWSPDDSQILLMNYVSVNESSYHLVDVKSGKMTHLTPKADPPVSYGGAEFSNDGKGLFYTSDEGTEFKHLRHWDLKSGKSTILTGDIPWDVEGMDLSMDGKTLAFIVNEAGASKLYLMDTGTRKAKALTSVPLGLISGAKWHNNSRDVAFTLNSARSTNDVYSIDTKKGSITRWTTSEMGGLNPNQFSLPKLIKWKSFDGVEISGWLNSPPDKFKGPRPVMIELHGGPEGQATPGFMGRYNYYLNELGIAVIQPNVRGSTGFGKTFVKLDNGYLRENTYKDIGALLDSLKLIDGLDPNRVMVTGGSYGGHMSFALAYMYPDKIACALPVVGISNLVTFLENTAAYRRDLRRVEYGDERDPKMREYLLKIAPMNNSQKITKPIFVVQGQNDPRVPISEAQQFVDKIKGVNPNVWYLVAKDEGHGFVKKKNRDYQMYATVLFMQKYLLK